ncbi:MAG: hypothetical protein AB8B74_05235 [Crocinitomicaceae bacterium]
MKKLFLIATILFLALNLNSQTNESPMSAYQWKGKKTVLEPGYVVLKSSKKLEGKISLQGKNGGVTGVYFEGDGKEINFPLAAMKAYGINSASNSGTKVANGNTSSSNYTGPLVCDNNEELFTWRDMGVQMGKQINNTKPRSGYVIKRDGTTIEGELQIKKVDGQITEFVVKSSNGKFKLPTGQIGHYGLKMTMKELTKDGSKAYNDEARNFHKGSIQLPNGESLQGFVAFKKKTQINPNRPGAGDKYNGMYFAASESDFVKTYVDAEVLSINQNINGVDVLYSPYEGGFVSSTTMDGARYSDQSKAFNKGVLTLANGESRTGEIAKPNNEKINFRSPEGIISSYQPNEVKKVEAKVEGQETVYINVDGYFVEEFVNGDAFWVYENPKPTTVNQRKTNLANSIQSGAASATSAAVLHKTEKDLGVDMNLDSIMRSKTTEELIAARLQTAKAYGYNSIEELDAAGEIPNETVNRLDFAMRLEIASRDNSNDMVIYYKEVFVINKSTNEKIVLYKDKSHMTEKLEGILMGCYTFLELDKKEQKEFYEFDNIRRTFRTLEECY